MGLSRRQAVFTALGTLVLGGCSAGGRQYVRTRPTAGWDSYPAGPSRPYGHTTVRPAYSPPNSPAQPGTTGGIAAIARGDWATAGPVATKVNPMNGVTKITVHHEGWRTVNFTDQRTTADRIETIRAVHVRDRGWGDIGYHYIVDRAGRVWEGRAIQYQGAHVSQNNEHNIGILVLGNFEKQSPSQAQLAALFHTAARLKEQHRVQPAMVRSHQEINPTTCPGRNLQRQMDALRRHVG